MHSITGDVSEIKKAEMRVDESEEMEVEDECLTKITVLAPLITWFQVSSYSVQS